MKKFCVIPSYNEEKNILKAIEGVLPFVDVVIVVDDGSSDNTYREACKNKVDVVRHIINRGQGAALQTGNNRALFLGADIIIHFDADNQFVPEEISALIKPLVDNEADIVFGSRFLGKESNQPWIKKYFFQPAGLLFNRVFMGVSLSDYQNGFRALSRGAAKKIIIKNDGMAHNSEIQHKAHKLGLRIKEVPVTVIYNDFGQSLFGGRGRGSGGFKIVKDLFLAKFID